jgi:prepilin-type N-terminal cleavage/methylation domain-containing protein
MRRADGFTLIEVLVALMILAGGILMVSLAWSGNFMHIRKSNLYSNVAVLLERKMVETEAKYREKPITEIPEEEHGDFGSDHPQYRWAMKSHDMKFPDITPLLTSQDEGADETLLTMVKQMTEYLDKTVKEVRVSVFVKGSKGREQEFAATQYFVDYTQNFAGAAAGAGMGAGTGAGQ